MADDPEEAEDERVIELTSVSAIYPELSIDPSDPFTATIEIPVQPIKPLAILFPSLADGSVPCGLPSPPNSDCKTQDPSETTTRGLEVSVIANEVQEVHTLSHLPPVTLRINLPTGYPDDQPPDLELMTKIPWLPQEILRKVEKDGLGLWEEMGHSQMLFAYVDHLRDAAENGFGLTSTSTSPLSVPRNLEIVLLDFDIRAKRSEFEKATFDCGVCLEPKKGAVCHRMSQCGHVFCVACLQDFYNNCITEGDVGSVKCIAPKCGQGYDPNPAAPISRGLSRRRRKRDRTLEPSELLQIPLDQHIVERYIMLKRKKALESDQATIYCPRQWCQGPARSKKTEALDRGLDDESSDDDHPETVTDVAKLPKDAIPPAERLAICTDCTFAFCRVCKASWHGEFIICDPQRKVELTAEEEASEEYMKLHTSACPTCNARCQKTHGCNHMICFKCSSHFCYLCSSWLDAGNPYEHFNNPKKACHMRLWELEAGDGVGVERERGFFLYDDDTDDDGQDDNPLDDPRDVDTDNEADPPPPRAPLAPPPPLPPQHPNLHARHPNFRRPPARIRAAIARRRNAAAPPIVPAANNNNDNLRPQPGPENQEQVPRRPPPPPAGFVRRRPIEGIQRFLDMAQNDEEDAWDSDELGEEQESDSDDGFWEIPFR
ncbi:MAG: hypothetical protein Q9219_001550 [cf. Caloplaca sp. 3 TL-2023]